MRKITFRNPVDGQGADPWVVRDGETYYYCYSLAEGVFVARLEDLSKISRRNGVCVYRPPAGTMWSRDHWAPELHRLDGVWYIYVAADDGDNAHHRMYVLRGTGPDPTAPFALVGKLSDPSDKWAIDGTVLSYGGERWFLWSGWAGDENVSQNLYIAHMANPWTIDSERVLISKPDLPWERRGGWPKVNEGPAVLIRGEAVHVVYSASGSWSDDYCLGLLTCRSGNFMDPASWEKSPVPLMSKREHCFGPGHCSFTTAADGSVWIVYHANPEPGASWNGRSVRLQPVLWDGDTPRPMEPAPPGEELAIWGF